jgi:hypothetical protein
MDTSKDLAEEAAYRFLMYGTVFGAQGLEPNRALEVIHKYVSLAKPHLRSITMPSIETQVASIHDLLLPEDFCCQKAMKIFAIGDEPLQETERIEYWFIDRQGNWYWAWHTRGVGSYDYGTGTARHLVNRFVEQTDDGRVPLYVFSSVAAALRDRFVRTAERARQTSNDLTKAAKELQTASLEAYQIIPAHL